MSWAHSRGWAEWQGPTVLPGEGEVRCGHEVTLEPGVWDTHGRQGRTWCAGTRSVRQRQGWELQRVVGPQCATEDPE